MHASVLGQSLSTASRLAVCNALQGIKLNENYPNSAQLSFWGKISGSVKDYLIIAAVTTKGSAIKKLFYFSVDGGVSFSKMPEVDEFIREKSKAVRGTFTGNPSKKLRDKPGSEQDSEPEDEPDDNASNAEEKAPKKKERVLTELDRLADAVLQIDSSTCVVPKGAFVLTATGEIVRNESFKGLSATDAAKITSYGLFRDAQDSRTFARIRKAGTANTAEFLDPLSDAKGEWSVVVDDSGQCVKLRSLLYTGYEFSIKAGSAQCFSSGYFGTGEKNSDLAFMI
jgi:radial spoke head protein 9